MRVAIVIARAGSKRIPGKNKKLFLGEPMISYPLSVLGYMKAKRQFDSVVVSTDDDDIRDIAWAHGAQYLQREPEYAGDDVQTKAVMAREVTRLQLADNDVACCIYPTAVMMDYHDLWWCMDMLWMRPAYFVVPVGTEPLADAGQFYCSLAGHWKDTVTPIYGIRTSYYPIEPERVCDINTIEDFERAERMYTALKEKPCDTR